MMVVLLKVFGLFVLCAALTLLLYRLFVKYDVDTSLDLVSALRDIANWLDGK